MQNTILERFNEVKKRLIFDDIVKNQQELADLLGLGKGNMSSLLNGKRAISENLVIKITETFPQIDKNWLLTGEGSMLKAPINEVEIPETPPIEINSNGNIKYYYEMSATASNLEFLDNNGELGEPYRFLNIAGFRGDCVAMNVAGDSMYPTAKDKDIVVIGANEVSDIINGEIYLIVTNDGQRMIKRLVIDKDNQQIICISDNSNKKLYADFSVDPDRITRIFRVKGFIAITFTG